MSSTTGGGDGPTRITRSSALAARRESDNLPLVVQEVALRNSSSRSLSTPVLDELGDGLEGSAAELEGPSGEWNNLTEQLEHFE
eukprot:scaffold1000_cov125-Isochrysis_galbana.AAC.1